MNYPALPLHTCTNEEIHEVIQHALQQERKAREQEKVADKKRMITENKFFKSNLFKRT